MLEAFQKYIQSKSLFNKSDKILLAVSGGLDSMVMLHLFKTAGYYFEVAHCNFSLRGLASDGDEKFVKSYCKNNNIVFHSIKFDTRRISKINKQSIEETARNLRYEWFNGLIKTKNLQYIATAHHKNDVTETMLINLTRGTGIAGLHGILAKRDNIIRPILFATKIEIEEYANQSKIDFVYDQTNGENEYTRNKFRNEIIPIFNNLNPDFIQSTNLLASYIKETEDIVSYFVDEIRKKTMQMQGDFYCIDCSLIEKQIFNQTLLFELIKSFGFNSSQTSDIYSVIGKSGKKFHSKEYTLFVDRKKLLITLNSSNTKSEKNYNIDTLPCKINIHGATYSFELIERNLISQEDLLLKKSQYLSFDSIKLPLNIRKPIEGERMSPYGLKGTKKISDFITDKKINIALKKQILGIYVNEIIALLDIEIDNKFAIKNTTKIALKVTRI